MMAKKKFEKKQEDEVNLSSVAETIPDSEIVKVEVVEVTCENISTPVKDIFYIPEPVHVVSSSDVIREDPTNLEVSPNLEEVKVVVQENEIKADTFSIDLFEDEIKELSKQSKYQLASELSKIQAILCDLNHAFAHLSNDGKLISKIILERTLILKS